MGHIELASPVAHVWFFKGAPSLLSLLLNISSHDLTAVIYFSQYLVLDVDKKRRKEAVLKLEAVFKKKKEELAERVKEVVAAAEKEGVEEIEKIKEKIRDKEQQELAIEEARLQTRRKVASLRDNFSSEERVIEEFYKTLQEKVKGIKRGSLLSEDEYWELSEQKITSFFKAEMGAEAILKLIKELDLKKLAKELKKEIKAEKAKVFTVNATRIALDILGRPIYNTAMLGALAKAAPLVSLDSLDKVVKERFPGTIGEKNVAVIKRAYEEAKSVE
mgnify:CR=1 FL=1